MLAEMAAVSQSTNRNSKNSERLLFVFVVVVFNQF